MGRAASLYSLLIISTTAASNNSTGTALGTLILSNNKLHSASAFASVLAMVDLSVVTSNHIYSTFFSNAIKSTGISLMVYVPGFGFANIAKTAVTGNVFIGQAQLPPRPSQTPALPDWITYNMQL